MKIVNPATAASVNISFEDLAAQLTLIDLRIFKSITVTEILNLGYTTSASTISRSSSSSKSSSLSSSPTSSISSTPSSLEVPTSSSSADQHNDGLAATSDKNENKFNMLTKQQLLPNVVAMNNQFNRVTFWIIDQVLSHQSSRSRAELISQFIKTAKRLYELNNLHSAYAFISALNSTPIYRLDKTWQVLRKKYPSDKHVFNQLKEFFSDTNNYEMLRLHLRDCQLPCIPYLGMYSRDIIYIKEAHRDGSPYRANCIKKIIDSIVKLQTSEYHDLKYDSKLSSLILSCHYIDELQKFAQEKSYRRSIELEPPAKLIHKPGILKLLIHNLISNKYMYP